MFAGVRTSHVMQARAYRSFETMAAETGFAIAAFGCGLFDAPIWLAGLAATGMLVYWAATRNRILNRLRGAAWATVMIVGLAAVIAIQAGAYWLGLAAGEII
ncbi:MAG: hypothetical protein A4S17_12080 [Proteobacteria bacterium HN_bin10]|nr:MAG: hypothetical protein A4S17_12080 [Proteobacteria bacterium HN_bin10]